MHGLRQPLYVDPGPYFPPYLLFILFVAGFLWRGGFFFVRSRYSGRRRRLPCGRALYFREEEGL